MRYLFASLVAYTLLLFYAKTEPLSASENIPAPISISEVYAAPTSDQKEWIELFNHGSTAVSLLGWELFDQLSTPSLLRSFTIDDFIAPKSYFVVELNSSKLNNAEDGVILYNQDKEIVHAISYQLATANFSISFLDDLETRQEVGLPSTPTPLSKNQPSPSPSPEASNPAAVSSPSPNPSSQSDADGISIQDFLACPEKNQQEWVLLLNTTSEEISLQGWRIQDAQANIVDLTGKTIKQGELLTVSFPNHILNNSGDTVHLYNGLTVIDSKTYISCGESTSALQQTQKDTMQAQPEIPVNEEVEKQPSENSIDIEKTKQFAQYATSLQKKLKAQELILQIDARPIQRVEKFLNQQEKVVKKEYIFGGILSSIVLIFCASILL